MFCRALAGTLVAVLAVSALPARADNPSLKEALALQEAMQNAIQEAEPAVVCILVSRSEVYRKHGTPAADGTGKLGGFVPIQVLRQERDPLDMASPGYVPQSYGSGVVVDEIGLILTNEHVIRDATKIFVRLPGGKGTYADIHAADPRSDLAVLRLIEPPPRLKSIKMGDGGKARKGQWVLSLANPFAAGFRDGSPSASWGIISNIRRRPATAVSEQEQPRSLHHYGLLLQTDARLNLGSSGGALIDLKGELIGLTTALAALSGSETAGGFAVPLDAGIKRIIEVLKRGEEVEYGFLGVMPGQPHPGGGLGVQVSHHMPAERAGLQDRDVILSVNGTRILDADDLFLAIGTALAGSAVRVEVLGPNSKTRTLTATLAKFYVPGKIIASRKPPAVRGLRVDYLSVLQGSLPPGAQQFGIAHGVIVREVLPGSSAAGAQLKLNDIITHVKGQPVHTPADFYKRLQALAGPVELTIANSQQVELK